MKNEEKIVDRLLKRCEVPLEETWDLSELFADDAAWEVAFKAVETELPSYTRYKGHLADGPELLAEALERMDDLTRRLENIYSYAHQMKDTDVANNRYVAFEQRGMQLISKASAATSYLRTEVVALEEEKLQAWLQANPRLAAWTHALDSIRRGKAHTLSAREERILASLSPVLAAPETTYGILSDGDLPFPEVEGEGGKMVRLSDERYVQLMESADRDVRRRSFEAMYQLFGQYRNTFASTLASAVSANTILADLRGFSSAREAALFSNAVPESVYDGLLDGIHAQLPLLHRYCYWRKKALKLDTFHSYDIYAPIVHYDRKISFDDAKQMVLEALEPLGSDYQAILRKAFTERWIDYAENEGKRGGAYSVNGCYDAKPYILMTWKSNISSLYTLVHELGHSCHTYLTNQHQAHRYSDYPIFLAEIASTCNENLLTDYLLKRAKSPEERLYYLSRYLDGFKATVFRQTQFAEFEYESHRRVQAGEALTADLCGEIYGSLNRKYYGDGLHYDEAIALEWARIPHFYYNFYVFQYATGFAAASAFAGRILRGEEGALQDYLGFLSAGSSDYPMDVLKRAGLDMASPDVVRKACAIFESYLAEAERATDGIDPKNG